MSLNILEPTPVFTLLPILIFGWIDVPVPKWVNFPTFTLPDNEQLGDMWAKSSIIQSWSIDAEVFIITASLFTVPGFIRALVLTQVPSP